MTIRHFGTFALSLALLLPVSVGAGGCATTQPVAEQNSDIVITSRVGRRLVADPDVQRFNIDVDTLQGVVYLRGKVDTATMKTSAEQIAKSTDGVRKVINELVVDPDRRGDMTDGDYQIKTRVGRSLSADDDVRRLNVDIDVIDGVVTLSGIVHNEAEAKEAQRLASETEGVIGVKNDLKVEMHDQTDSEKTGKVDDDGDRDDDEDAGEKPGDPLNPDTGIKPDGTKKSGTDTMKPYDKTKPMDKTTPPAP